MQLQDSRQVDMKKMYFQDKYDRTLQYHTMIHTTDYCCVAIDTRFSKGLSTLELHLLRWFCGCSAPADGNRCCIYNDTVVVHGENETYDSRLPRCICVTLEW